MSKVRIASVSEIPFGKSKRVSVNGIPVAVFNVDGKFYALADACTHKGGWLHEGELSGTAVTCPVHGAEFDVTNGRVLAPPATIPARTFKVVQEGNELFIEA